MIVCVLQYYESAGPTGKILAVGFRASCEAAAQGYEGELARDQGRIIDHLSFEPNCNEVRPDWSYKWTAIGFEGEYMLTEWNYLAS